MHATHDLDTDDQELLAAGFPEQHLAAARDAEAAFWGEISSRYPELTAGDSQLSGEPRNAMAIWIAAHVGARLNLGRLPVMPSVDNDLTCTPRFQWVLDDAIAAAKTVLRRAGLDVSDAPDDVRAMLQGCAEHLLDWNLPEDVDHG